MFCYLNKRQREAALMSGLDKIATIGYKPTGLGPWMLWEGQDTKTIVDTLRQFMPEHSARSVPYHSLICKVITAHRSPE